MIIVGFKVYFITTLERENKKKDEFTLLISSLVQLISSMT